MEIIPNVIECSLNIKNVAVIPMYEELTDSLLEEMKSPKTGLRISKWMNEANIEIVNYDSTQHVIKPSHDLVLELFWNAVQKIAEGNEINSTQYVRLVINAAKEYNPDPKEWRQYFNLLSEFSQTHFRVLHLIYGVLDYYDYIKLTPPNTLDTLNTLDKVIEDTIPELRGEYEKTIRIWEDLARYGLRKQESLYLRMTVGRMARFSMLTDSGIRFLRLFDLN